MGHLAGNHMLDHTQAQQYMTAFMEDVNLQYTPRLGMQRWPDGEGIA